jgi:putative nucleotidyltransferase with HDIG domain
MDLQEKLLATFEADIAANRLVLPTLPDVALEVRRIAGQPDPSVAQLAAVIARDAALTARLLKVANSASLRGRQPVETVKGAIQRLGLRLVCSLVNNLAILQSLTFGDAQLRAMLKYVSDHSLEVAVLSHAIAAQHTRLDPDEAMLAGLIHDIGQLPLLRRAAELDEVRDHLELAAGACFRLHCRVGAMVLESWDFAPELVAVAREHEDLERPGGPAPDLVDVVVAANLLSQSDPAWANAWSVRRLGLVGDPDPAPKARREFARELLGG